MSRWFRVYDSLVDDPKVQLLPDEDFKGLVNLWCLAARNNGELPPIDAIAFSLRATVAWTQLLITRLKDAGLIDQEADTGVTHPHNWDGRQFKSDTADPTAAERNRRYRERNKARNADRNGDAPQRTDTDTEPEKVATQPSAREAEKPIGIPIVLWRGERTPEWFSQIETEARDAAGLADDPSPALFDTSPLVTLIDQGFDFARDILPKLRAAKAAGKKGRTWAYYVPSITEGKTANGKIAPKVAVSPAKPMVWVLRDAPDWAAHATEYRRVHRRDPPTKPGLGGMGWHFEATP